MEVTFHATTSFDRVHVILKTITRTRTLKGGGFGLTPSQTGCAVALEAATAFSFPLLHFLRPHLFPKTHALAPWDRVCRNL